MVLPTRTVSADVVASESFAAKAALENGVHVIAAVKVVQQAALGLNVHATAKVPTVRNAAKGPTARSRRARANPSRVSVVLAKKESCLYVNVNLL